MQLFYRFIRRLAWLIGLILYRIEVTGTENIPKSGRFLLCGNHIHAFDPVALAIVSTRQLRFMAKKQLFKRRLIGAFLRKMGAFPIDRGNTDMTAFRKSLDILKREHGLLIFSQGTRMKDFEDAKAGVAVFALKTSSPIIPVGIRGNYRFRSTLYIDIGEPISMEEHEGKKVKSELVDEVMEVVINRVSVLAK